MPFLKHAKLEIKKIYSSNKAGAYNWRDVLASVSEAEQKAQKQGQQFKAQASELPSELYTYDTKNFIYLKARAISGMEKWGPNQNFDAFPWSEIEKSYPTFVGKGIYLEHDEDTLDKAMGLILDAEVAPNDEQYIICTFCVDRNQYPELCQKLLDGTIKTVSMSCLAGSVSCSLCGQEARDEKQLCDHMREFEGPRDANGNLIKFKQDPMTGLQIPLTQQDMIPNLNYCKGSLDPITGQRAYEINRDLVFVGLSAVEIPADKDAFIDQFNIKASKKQEKLDSLAATRIEMNRYITAKNKFKETQAKKTTKGEFGAPVVDYDIDEDTQTVEIYLDDGSYYSYAIQDRPMLTEFELAFKQKDNPTNGRQNYRKVNDLYNEVIKKWPTSKVGPTVLASRKTKRTTAKALKASLEENIQETDKYLSTLMDIKDKLLAKIDSLAQAVKNKEKASSTATDVTEKEALDNEANKDKEDIKFFQKTLEQVKDKLVETKTQEFKIALDRELNLAQLYTSLNLSPDMFEEKVVSEEKPMPKEKPIETPAEAPVESRTEETFTIQSKVDLKQLKRMVKNMKEQDGKSRNFVINYLQGKVQPEQIKEILEYAGYLKQASKKVKAYFETAKDETGYYVIDNQTKKPYTTKDGKVKSFNSAEDAANFVDFLNFYVTAKRVKADRKNRYLDFVVKADYLQQDSDLDFIYDTVYEAVQDALADYDESEEFNLTAAAKVEPEDEANNAAYQEYADMMQQQDDSLDEAVEDYTEKPVNLNPIEKTLEEDYAIDFSYDYNTKFNGIDYSVKFDLDENNKMKDGAVVTELETGKVVSDPELNHSILADFKNKFGI